MPYDQRDGAKPSRKEHEAGDRAGRKRLGEDGRPKDELASERQDAANRTKTTVKHALKRGSQETERAMDEK